MIPFCFLIAGAYLGFSTSASISTCKLVNATVCEVDVTSFARHGRPIVRPKFQFLNPFTNQTEQWQPIASSSRFRFEVGDNVELWVGENPNARHLNDLVSNYFVAFCLIALGVVSGTILGMFSRVLIVLRKS